jgi:hypothetical protein
MSEMQLILNDTFWKFLVSFEELKEKKDKFLFCASLNIEEDTLKQFQEFLSHLDIICKVDELYIHPLKEQCRIKMEFSLSEWLALQACFFQADSKVIDKNYYQKIVQDKMLLTQKAFEQFNLYRKPIEISVKMGDVENLKKKIDFVISYRKSISIQFLNDKICSMLPHRMVYLDGILCVVGESISDKTLVYFGVEDIKEINQLALEYGPNLSQIEINEFIGHLRLINGKEERLVLKIYSQYEADLLPSHHYLGNPFVTSNSEGEMIWAATIEICDDLFQWLYSLKEKAEVLDPGHVRKEFAHYCEIKKENSGSKKAS